MNHKAAVRKLRELGRLEETGNHVTFSRLSEKEVRVLQIAITDGLRRNGKLDSKKDLVIDAEQYADVFGITAELAISEIKQGLDALFEGLFSYVSVDGFFVKSRYVASIGTDNLDSSIFYLTLASSVSEKLMSDLDILAQRMKGSSGELVDLSYTELTNANEVAKADVELKSEISSALYWFFIENLSMGYSNFEIHYKKLMSVLVISEEYPTAQDFKESVLDGVLAEIAELSDISVSCSIKPKVRADRYAFKIKETGCKKITV